MDPVNMPHLHLLLNHVPTVGSVVGIGLFVLGLVRRGDHLTRASFEVLFLVAVVTFPAYLTGVAAEVSVAGRPEFSPAGESCYRPLWAQY